jgi:hypothetical protein
MKFIENEGALFRGFSRSHPQEVWHPESGWKPYIGSVPKPIEWGHEISRGEAWRMMAEAQGAPEMRELDFGTPD